MTQEADYTPGVCNINQKESKKRLMMGTAGLAAASLTSILYLGLSLPNYYLILVFFLSALGFQGIIQSNKNFCIGHAFQGTEKTGEDSNEIKSIDEKVKDRIYAKKLAVKAFGYGILFTVSIYLCSIIMGY